MGGNTVKARVILTALLNTVYYNHKEKYHELQS